MSRLLESSCAIKDTLLAKNSHSPNEEYVQGHPNALSDGDELGKGELNGSVGSNIDIAQRSCLRAKNMYTSEKPYNIDNA